MKDRLNLLIRNSTKTYKCDYATSSVVGAIIVSFETFEFSKEKWLKVFQQVIYRVYRDLGTTDYKDIKRVNLPIGRNGKKMMAMFYENRQCRRYISNFMVYDSDI